MPLILVGIALTVLLSVSETLQHWILSAAVATVSHSTTLVLCIGFTCGYHELIKIAATPPAGDFND